MYEYDVIRLAEEQQQVKKKKEVERKEWIEILDQQVQYQKEQHKARLNQELKFVKQVENKVQREMAREALEKQIQVKKNQVPCGGGVWVALW